MVKSTKIILPVSPTILNFSTFFATDCYQFVMEKNHARTALSLFSIQKRVLADVFLVHSFKYQKSIAAHKWKLTFMTPSRQICRSGKFQIGSIENVTYSEKDRFLSFQAQLKTWWKCLITLKRLLFRYYIAFALKFKMGAKQIVFAVVSPKFFMAWHYKIKSTIKVQM